MTKPLEEQYSWEELGKLMLQRLAYKIKAKDHSTFLRWFNEREKVGLRFDYRMVYRTFRIWQEIQAGYDHFCVITGREGIGKSTFGIQLAAWLNPDGFDQEDVITTAANFVQRLRLRASQFETEPDDTRSLLLDEGTELLSREAMSTSNKVLIKTMFIQRQLRCFVVVCCPNFWLLDSVLRVHRCRTLIHCIGRAKYKAICGKNAIAYLSKQGEKTKNISSVKLMDGTFWHGHWSVKFPKTIDEAEYKKGKQFGIKGALENLSMQLGQPNMVLSSTLAKHIGVTPKVLNGMIRRKEVPGTKVGHRYYLTKENAANLLGKAVNAVAAGPINSIYGKEDGGEEQ